MKTKIFSLVFENPKMSAIWFLVRLYVGWEWLYAGYEKMVNVGGVWVGDKAGVAITGFVNGALAKTVGEHPDVSQCYAWFLSHLVQPYAVFWSYAVTYGEILVGLGLILGVLTSLAAFFGFFMNLNYLMAGTVSTNPQLLIWSLLIMLADKVNSNIGLQRFIFRKAKS